MVTVYEYEEMMKPIKMVNRLISIWPLEENDNSILSRLRIFHRISMFILILIQTVAVTADIVHHWGSMKEVTECALIATAFYLCVLRLTVYTIHDKDLQTSVQIMKNDWIKFSGEDELTLKEKCLPIIKLAKFFIMTVFSTIGLFMVAPILEVKILGMEEKKLPFRGYFFENQTITPAYGGLYLLGVTAGGFGGSMIAGATTLNLILVMHGAAKFMVVRKNIESLKSNSENSITFIDCVRGHQDAILFAERVENTINVLVLGQFVISTGLVCFAGFQITEMAEDRGQLMKYTSFLNSAIFELFLFSYSGNELLTESDAISQSCYASNWVGTSFAKSMQIVMTRSLSPCKITAVKFYDMSLANFSSIFSFSFSYLTVLRTMEAE
uniref:Odorant receptor n=1 Tax=Microplitis mediator TaxID=375433 RepID=M1RS86_9HYME|nr:olfactory receptor 1 [Microplitis mediator]